MPKAKMDPALIVKEGVLVKSRNHGVRLAFLKSQWVPRYFVLRRKDGTSGQFLLDQYWKQSKRKIKRSLEMDRCCKVESYLKLSETAANQQNYEWIFAIHYTKRDSEGRSKLFLAANNKEEMDAWVYELCKCCKFLADETDSYAESSLSNGVTPLFQRPRMPVDRLPLFAPDLRSEDSFLVDTPMSECGPGSFGFSRTFDETSLQLSARPKTSIDVPLSFEDEEERERFVAIQFPSTGNSRKCTVRSSPLVSPSNEDPPSAIGNGILLPSIVLPASKVNPSPNYIHLKGCGGSLAGSLPRRTPLPNRVSEEDDNQGKRPKENTNPYMHLNKCGTNPKPRERFVRPGPIVPHHSSGASQHSQKPSISSLEGTSPTSSQRSIVHTDPDDSSSGFDSFGSVPPPLPPKISARSSIDSSTYSGMSRDSPPLPLAPPIPAVINLDMAVPTTFPDDVYEVDTSGETIIRQRTPSPSFEEPVETPKTPFTAPPIDRSTKPRMVSLSRSDSSQSNPASPFAAHTPTRTNIFNFRDTERIIPIIPKTNPQNRQLNKQLTANDLFPHRPQKALPVRESVSQCSSPVASRPVAKRFLRSPPAMGHPPYVLDYFDPQPPLDPSPLPPMTPLLDAAVPCTRKPLILTHTIDYVDVDKDRTQALKFASVERNAL